MPMFSANLGYLWTELPLPDAIRAAKAAGFDAVECHWPFDVPADDVVNALRETGLEMLGLNTQRGDVEHGEIGLAALPGRQDAAQAAIKEASDYAAEIGTEAIHVMAGLATGEQAEAVYLENLVYAAEVAGARGQVVLIEPLNAHDAPGYFLKNTVQAVQVIEYLGVGHLKLMFDCYHVARAEGDVLGRLASVFPHVGHIQFAGVPDRGPPDQGSVDFCRVFRGIDALKWDRPLGAEYRPGGATEDSLGWMEWARNV